MVKLLISVVVLTTLIGVTSCWVIRHTYQVESLPGSRLTPHHPIGRGRKVFISRRKPQAAPRAVKASPNTGFRTMLNVPHSGITAIIRTPKVLAVRNPVPRKTPSASRAKKTSSVSAIPIAKAKRRRTKKIILTTGTGTKLTKEELANIRAEAMDLDIYEKPRTTIITKGRIGRYPVIFYRRF